MPGLSIRDIYNEFMKIIRISGRLKNICHKLKKYVTLQGTQTVLTVSVPFLLAGNSNIRSPPE